MIYQGKFEIDKETLKYYNELLQVDLDCCSPYYNEDEIERLDARIDDYIGIGLVEFSNGCYATIDIASGSSNYYENIVLYDKNGDELDVSDCTYELNSVELYYDEDTYIIKFVGV